ncbi:MAG TPA: hypothetical protein VHM72_08730 [Solirubrobacteraceae bacterium]|nr:hypothetical protein [Solirubrobacteraceae bacterium]
MRAVVPSALIAAVVMFAAPALASGGSNRIGGCTKSQVKPSAIVLFCGDDGAYVDHIRWSAFGGATAHGSGTYAFNPCKPDCAASKDKTYSVKFTASQAKPCWDAHDDYRALELFFAAGAPHATQKFTLYCPAG